MRFPLQCKAVNRRQRANKVGPYPGDRIVVEETTLERGPCILVRILDNPVCFSGCLSTTHVRRFSLFEEPRSLVRGGGTRGRNRSAVSPPRTRCHQAQLGMSLGHQHVYQAFFPDESASRWATLPSLFLCSPLLSPIALFLSLISFHSPTRDAANLSLFLSLLLSPSPSFVHFPRCCTITPVIRVWRNYTSALMTSR